MAVIKPETTSVPSERAFFDDRTVTVTPTRVIFHGANADRRTIPLSAISSVQRHTTPEQTGLAVVLIIIGLLTACCIAGIPLLVWGIVLMANAQPTYYLSIHGAGGELQLLRGMDQAYIDGIVAAIDKAIIKRG